MTFPDTTLPFSECTPAATSSAMRRSVLGLVIIVGIEHSFITIRQEDSSGRYWTMVCVADTIRDLLKNRGRRQ